MPSLSCATSTPPWWCCSRHGLSPEATEELLARLPAHPGDTLTIESAEAMSRALKDFDEHLRMGFAGRTSDEVTMAVRLNR